MKNLIITFLLSFFISASSFATDSSGKRPICYTKNCKSFSCGLESCQIYMDNKKIANLFDYVEDNRDEDGCFHAGDLKRKLEELQKSKICDIADRDIEVFNLKPNLPLTSNDSNNEGISGCEGGEVSADGTFITCPDGKVFRLDTSQNQILRYITPKKTTTTGDGKSGQDGPSTGVTKK